MSPKNVPLGSAILHMPVKVPPVCGAVMGTDNCVWAPESTGLVSVRVVPPIASPPTRLNLKPAVQLQLPRFCTSQVLVKACPGCIDVLSGMVTSFK